MGTNRLQKEEYTATLKKVLPRGSVVYSQLLRLNIDGNGNVHRVYAFYTIAGGAIWKLDGYLAVVLGCRLVEGKNTPRGLSTQYASHLVNQLSYYLHNDGSLNHKEWI